MSRSKQKGTAAETAVVNYLRDHGFGTAERRALAGKNDLGDILTGPGLAWEIKAHKRYAIPEWLNETEDERENADAEFGILIVKPVGVGAANVGKWWFILTVDQGVAMLRDAGYGDPR